jgi:hypothetical protein
MPATSKISRFSRPLREELNRRLDNGETNNCILLWINSIPEVQEICASHYNGAPIIKQNLLEWRKSGFAHWQLCQTALRFTQQTAFDDLDEYALDKIAHNLTRALQIRYAALAASLPPPGKNYDTELKRLGELCSNITALRRNDLSAGRLTIEQERLDLEKGRTQV